MRPRSLAVAVIAVALLARLGLALLYDPPAASGDAADYARHAEAISESGTYPPSQSALGGGPSAFRPPGYPFLLALTYEVLGRDAGPRVVGALLGTLAVVLLGLVG